MQFLEGFMSARIIDVQYFTPYCNKEIHMYNQLVRNGMDVKEYERLSNFTLRYKLKERNT